MLPTALLTLCTLTRAARTARYNYGKQHIVFRVKISVVDSTPSPSPVNTLKTKSKLKKRYASIKVIKPLRKQITFIARKCRRPEKQSRPELISRNSNVDSWGSMKFDRCFAFYGSSTLQSAHKLLSFNSLSASQAGYHQLYRLTHYTNVQF